MTTKPTTDEQPQPAEFAAFLVGHLGGRTHEEIGVELHQLLEAVKAHGKKGSLTITVVIEPPSNGVEGAPSPSASSTPPRPPRQPPPRTSTSSTTRATPPARTPARWPSTSAPPRPPPSTRKSDP